MGCSTSDGEARHEDASASTADGGSCGGLGRDCREDGDCEPGHVCQGMLDADSLGICAAEDVLRGDCGRFAGACEDPAAVCVMSTTMTDVGFCFRPTDLTCLCANPRFSAGRDCDSP